jgi:hypothetical protein
MQLLDLLRNSDQPTLADRERIRRNVALQVAAGATVAATLAAAQNGSWLLRGGAVAAWLKGATLATLLVGAGIASTHFLSTKSPPPAAIEAVSRVNNRQPLPEVTAPNPPQTAEESNAIEVPPNQESVTVTAKRLAPAVKSPTTTNRSANLEAELELIGQAQRALKAGQPGEALRALDEHQRRFPAGSLSFERVGVRTVALCQAGRLADGRAAARSYLRKVPNSVLSKRIRVACQMTDE